MEIRDPLCVEAWVTAGNFTHSYRLRAGNQIGAAVRRISDLVFPNGTNLEVGRS